MSDIAARTLRTAATVYDASYPPSILDGGTGELIVNGDFTTDLAGWDNTGTWYWDAGDAVSTGNENGLMQNVVLTQDVSYRVVVDADTAGGSSQITFAGQPHPFGDLDITYVATTSGTATLSFLPDIEICRVHSASVTVVPDPHIDSLVPNAASAAAGPITVTVTGTNFEPASVVEINGTAQATTYVSDTSLTISYDPTVAGTVTFTVRNTSGKESNDMPFNVSTLSTLDSEPGGPQEPDMPEPQPQPGPDQPEPMPQPETQPGTPHPPFQSSW